MLKLVDDVLDFTGTEEQLGKPVSIDLKLGLATGPVLFAAQEYPELQILISRKYFLPVLLFLAMKIFISFLCHLFCSGRMCYRF